MSSSGTVGREAPAPDATVTMSMGQWPCGVGVRVRVGVGVGVGIGFRGSGFGLGLGLGLCVVSWGCGETMRGQLGLRPKGSGLGGGAEEQRTGGR